MSSNQDYPTRYRKSLVNSPSISLIAATLIGFTIFATFQIIMPLLADQESMTTKLITKEEAIQRANQLFSNEVFATSSLNGEHKRVEMDTEVIYNTNDLLSGYISKEQLSKSYKPWEALAPYDVYRVLVRQRQGTTSLNMEYAMIDIHMTTGKLVGFQIRSSNIPTVASKLSEEERISLTASALREIGYQDNQLQLLPVSPSNSNEIRYSVPAAKVGDASLELNGKWWGDRLISLNPVWSVPDSFEATMNHQKQTAESILTYAYTWASVLMGLAAFICAIIYRKVIVFQSRTILLLAALSCLISIVHAWNILPSMFMLESQVPLKAQDVKLALLVQSGITFIQGGLTLYLAIVTGRALWIHGKHDRKFKLLSTWSQDDFGQTLVRSFWNGLCWSGILLGLQSIIFTGLEYGVDSWTSSDSNSSPLNLTYMYLYPLVAYVAAIAEEGFYRLFGVGLFRRFIPNMWIAAIIPTFVWAAGHVTYPIYPFYSRPAELMIIGLLFVWIMVRYGFWTAVIAHLMIDTILMVLSLFMEQTFTGIAVGSLYLLLPLAIVYTIRSLHNNRRTVETWTAP